MKIIFVGPTLPDAMKHAGNNAVILPPASQGDIMKAVAKGATVIGLIDGYFEYAAPVWHKEILYALKQGCQVLGAASMGALRASECFSYGMRGVGVIYDDYRCGRRVDDGDVALLHGPAELGYPAISIPLTNVDATLAKAADEGILSQDQAVILAQKARSIFFKQRTWKRITEGSMLPEESLNHMLESCHVDQKRHDALALLAELLAAPDVKSAWPEWEFHTTPTWRRLYGQI